MRLSGAKSISSISGITISGVVSSTGSSISSVSGINGSTSVMVFTS